MRAGLERTQRCSHRGTRAPYHIVQRELGPLSEQAAVHGDHGAAVVVEPVPITALLIGQQVNPTVLEDAERAVGCQACHSPPSPTSPETRSLAEVAPVVFNRPPH